MENMKEIWKDIEDYEGLYQISNCGRVKSIDHMREQLHLYGRMVNTNYKGKILKPHNSRGYLRVRLFDRNKSKNISIHRLVAEAFIPNPNNYPQINHKDEDKTNNNVDNLEWCTPAYNANYGTRKKRIIKKQSIPIIQYTLDGKFVKEYSSIAEAARQTGINLGNICSCCRGNINYSHAGGFKWQYK